MSAGLSGDGPALPATPELCAVVLDVLYFSITLLSFAVAMLVARALSKHSAFAFLQRRSGRYGTLDGLRGFLATAVFFHHFFITWHWKGSGDWARPDQIYIYNYGHVGVALFFMITGFLFISRVVRNQGHQQWLSLYESRIFRIYPLYLFVVVALSFCVFYQSHYRLQVSAPQLTWEYLKWIFFDGGDINHYAQTDLVIAGVDWTLKYEWAFYLLLPLFALTLAKLNRTGAWLLIGLSLFLYFDPLTRFPFGELIDTRYFLLFAMGGMALYASNHLPVSHEWVRSKKISALTLLLLAVILFYPNTLDVLHIAMISAFFTLVALGNDLFGLLSLRSSALLGEISYSIYLVHGLILYTLFTLIHPLPVEHMSLSRFLLLLPLVSVMVVLISTATFLLIERPTMKLGHSHHVSNLIRNRLLRWGKAVSR